MLQRVFRSLVTVCMANIMVLYGEIRAKSFDVWSTVVYTPSTRLLIEPLSHKVIKVIFMGQVTPHDDRCVLADRASPFGTLCRKQLLACETRKKESMEKKNTNQNNNPNANNGCSHYDK